MKNKHVVLNSYEKNSSDISTIEKISLEIDELKESAKSILKHKISSLQVIPPVAVKLLKLTNDEASSFSDLTLIIETEPSLSIEVLRLVNSAFYNYSHKIVSIKRAVTLLGFSAIRQIALNLLFFKKIIKPHSKHEFNQIFFWQHCLFVATLSKLIAKEIKHPDPDMVYAAGLLHDIGKIVLETHGQLTYSDYMSSFEKSDNPSRDNEGSFFGISHDEMGAVFCKTCELPDSIIMVVLNHHRSFQQLGLDEHNKLNISIVAYANFIAWLQGIGSITRNDYPVLQSEVFEIINQYELDIEMILEKVDVELRNISHFYNFKFPSLSRLRANLIGTILNFNNNENIINDVRSSTHLNSLTVPHHSLNPDEFIPWTLKSLQDEFNFERLILLDINPKQRSLITRYAWPESILDNNGAPFEIMISSLSSHLLSCLRNKEAALVDDKLETDTSILKELQVDAFFLLPILMYNRLSSVLYIDNVISGKALDKKQLPALCRVTTELGIALVNAKQFEEEKKRAQIDPLTGLNNKGTINSRLDKLFTEDKRQLKHLAVGFIDIDYFKKFNDIYGHQAGDDVLRIVSDILKSLTRPNDFIARYGGEEFLFILYDTDEKGVYGFAERIRMEIEKKGILLKNRFPEQSLTASIGVVMYHNKFKDYLEMIESADEAMYQSKSEGRNRVTLLLHEE
ncbi:MAG: GGDEF domain-containing protein [Gammaproteobacteria bacterium]|nr:GGDEF domain-containing protein [Gammaproteobacteria bacterium]